MAAWPFLKYSPSTMPCGRPLPAGRELTIEASARQAGMVSLFEHGCMAVEQGLTTIEELVRVLGMPNGG
jgi:hypothetical protein